MSSKQTENDYACSNSLSQQEQELLLQIAEMSIVTNVPGKPNETLVSVEADSSLHQVGASFVTLRINSQLRGCMGTLEARSPLLQDVAHNAHAAAFRDPRFPPLKDSEFDQLDLHIAVLSPPEAMTVENEADFLSQMRPSVDGYTIWSGNRRGTLLPAVWKNISEPRCFLDQLKKKAGLPADYWSDDLRFARYQAFSFGRKCRGRNTCSALSENFGDR